MNSLIHMSLHVFAKVPIGKIHRRVIAGSKGICICNLRDNVYTHTHTACFPVSLLTQGTSKHLALCQSDWLKRTFQCRFPLHCSYYEWAEDLFICAPGGWLRKTASPGLPCLVGFSNQEAPGGDRKVGGERRQRVSFPFLSHSNAMFLMVAICLHTPFGQSVIPCCGSLTEFR